MLNGRIEPSGVVEGFSVDLSASGSFCPKRVTIPVTAFFFCLSDDNAPSPYLVSISCGLLSYNVGIICLTFNTLFVVYSNHQMIIKNVCIIYVYIIT